MDEQSLPAPAPRVQSTTAAQSSINTPSINTPDANGPAAHARKEFIGIMMKCCRTYVRAYLNPNGDAFIGRCPRCLALVRIDVVEEGGSPNRFFEAW
jgi:hypothetical protein